MPFTIKYEKTGNKIEIDDKRMYLLLSHKELKKLGFSSKDLLTEVKIKETCDLLPDRCDDPKCPNCGERLVDKGYGHPVCPSQPMQHPKNRQKMRSIYLREVQE